MPLLHLVHEISTDWSSTVMDKDILYIYWKSHNITLPCLAQFLKQSTFIPSL